MPLPPFLLQPEGDFNLLHLKYLTGSLALLWLLGGQISPAREVITPEGLKVVPETASRNTDQVVESGDQALHVVFRVFRSDQRKIAVYYSRRAPGGGWSAPIQISEDSDDCEPPVIAVCSDGRLLTAWIDRSVQDKFTVVIRCSDDHGKTWVSAGRYPAGVTRVQPKLAVSGNAAYLCFSSAPEAVMAQRLYFFRSGDGGKTWAEKDVNFKQPRSYSSQADLLARGDSVWVTWCDQDPKGVRSVVLTSSTDRGETWPREPIAVSDSRPETPSEATFDHSEPAVVVVWRAAQRGSNSFIYQDRCENGVACGKDQVLLKSDVIPLTYRIVRCGNNRVLLWLRGKGGSNEQQKRIYWADVSDRSSNRTDQVIVWPGAEHANFSQFDVQVINETLYLAAVARRGTGDWRVLLLSRKADGQDQKSIVGGEERKELSSLALFPLSSGIGWLLQERVPRRLPMESLLNDSLVFGRLEHGQ